MINLFVCAMLWSFWLCWPYGGGGGGGNGWGGGISRERERGKRYPTVANSDLLYMRRDWDLWVCVLE